MSDGDELSTEPRYHFFGFTSDEVETLLELVPAYRTFKNEAEQRVARIRAKLERACGLPVCLPTDENQ